MTMLRVGVLASGGGTNLQAIIDACEGGLIHAEVAVVVSDNERAYALSRARTHGIAAHFVDASDKEEHERRIDELFRDAGVELAVGAGYMRILSPWFIRRWYGRLINIHPALLPSFKGLDGQGQALAYGVKLTGCTTHFMDEETDHGPIILQAAVRVKEGDTRDTLAERILKVEHQILPRSIDLFEKKRLVIEGRRVKILPGDTWLGTHQYPDVFYSDGY
ncbi:MAG TPA: phosphoribosylglycinamide formyltransferase [Thermoplasmatales archaeon]|nr:MAG: phosphoribosylglycinamide formyltransferase [Thermoplasmata archaeon]HDN51019.1 phosphoribosylglycinamide formyltransferase [Thermoplasmatales archaeon]